jgi:hypothetical protein
MGHMPKRTLISLFVVAVLVNYLWELAQAPLYVGLESYNAAVFWHCFVASLGDGFILLLISAAGWIALHRWDWFKQPRVAGYLVMLISGLVLAILVEWMAVHILQRWEYTDKMPILPGIRIGVVPVGQMLILPPVVFRIVAVLGARKEDNASHPSRAASI